MLCRGGGAASYSARSAYGSEFNAEVDAKYSDLALADLAATFEQLYKTLMGDPSMFLRELTIGLVRLKDEVYLEKRAEKYGGERERLLKEDPTIHETEERSGNLLLLVGQQNAIGEWYNPDFGFDSFYALATEVNTATLMELSGTAVKDLPLTLTFRFWADNPFKGCGPGVFFVDILCKVWFERRSDNSIWVDLDESDEEGLEWLASYYLRTSRELSESEREKYTPSGTRKCTNRSRTSLSAI